jgi:hypothetical protein
LSAGITTLTVGAPRHRYGRATGARAPRPAEAKVHAAQTISAALASAMATSTAVSFI